ncbi:MAG: hypothetical protein L5655_11910, partial [Thermosediminibacteraceae bacterium]|nr:hypothetical protein [Thermosediminibacteraceae bacterium]
MKLNLKAVSAESGDFRLSNPVTKGKPKCKRLLRYNITIILHFLGIRIDFKKCGYILNYLPLLNIIEQRYKKIWRKGGPLWKCLLMIF